ncbi:hypothetical protein LTR78_000276 [Recurvomyces mirabilis]|uniref:Thymidylate kinase protein n=1 Tax=Recurvomyces mirabilis TaxID=574656 RepID=A0AAE0WXR1_9PEZI|nr:hypothetical protein LTR78_000276 [Recurvomyces mirabilis]KAK5161931.1 hypothetical protein LTS14_000277 [Recurvomyces mirabilis]
MARVPFAPLDNPRLQHLASAKNRQNGLSSQKSSLSGKASMSSLSKTTLQSPSKRQFDPSSTFDDYDSENIDPSVFSSPSKKSKNAAFNFSLTPVKAMPPPAVPARLATPIRANMSSTRTPMTAPAGRSPKRKIAGISKNRRVSAPFTRIEPPFASRGSSLPFSLDAALSGTFSTPAAPAAKSAGATIQESMPKGWFFEIYEDSPEEEASNLMEHSTLTLDLSSDEESSKKTRDDRGKENTPPVGYDAPAASRAVEASVGAPRQIKKTGIIRRKIVGDDMDDGERSPLSELETDPFFPEGLDKESHVIVDGTPEKTAGPSKVDITALFTAPQAEVESVKDEAASSMPVVNADGDLKGEIIVFEDDASTIIEPASEPPAATETTKSTKVEIEIYDENTVPVATM